MSPQRDARRVSPGVDALSSGEVTILVRGIRDRQHLGALLAVLGGIRGVDELAVLLFERPDAPLVSARVPHPVPLVAEIRAALGRTAVSCAVVGDRIEVVLAASGPAGSRPEAWGAHPRVDHRARTGPAGTGRPWARSGASSAWEAPAEPEPTMPPRRARRTRPGAMPAGIATAVRDGRGTSSAPPASAPPASAPHTPTPPASASGAGAPRDAPPRAGAPHAAPADRADPVTTTMAEAFAAERELSVFILGRDRRIRAAWGGLHRRSSRVTGSLVGQHLDDITTPDQLRDVGEHVTGALAGRTGTMRTASGSSDRVYDVTFNPVADGPDAVGCLLVTRDVTAHHRDQLLRAELTDVFETTFEHSPVGQALVSPSGQWLRVNEALVRLLGREAGALLGRGLRELTHPDDVDRENGLLYEVLASRATGYEIDKRIVRPDGTEVRVFARMSPVRTPAGAVRGFIAHVVDAERWGDCWAPRD